MKKSLWLIPGLALLPKITFAHCPLCTVGAGALAVLAASLGVATSVVGIMIGAFSLALGYWLAPLVKKKYIPYQRLILVLLIFLGTVIPIMPLIREYAPLYINLGGKYGTLLHNTYTINLFALGVIIGAIIMLITPHISKAITKARGKTIPYQGVLITILVLIIVSLIVQFFPW